MRKTIATLTALFLLYLPLSAQPQPPDTLWTQTLGGSDSDAGYSVQQTSDGGYIITGSTDSYGAGNSDVYLIKTDALGDTTWTKTFGGSSSDVGLSVQQTLDGGYIIAGYTQSYGAGNHDVYLIKTDASGDTAWTKTFGGSSSDIGSSVQQTVDRGYIIAGYTQSYGAGYYDVYLIKTDTSGNQQWYYTFGGNNSDTGNSVQQTSDGGYIIAGYTHTYGAGNSDVYLIKTDASGDTAWTKTFGGSSSDIGNSVQQTTGGGYIITGYTGSYGAGAHDVYLIKTDASGDTIWTKTFGGSDCDYGNSVQQTLDGGYIIAGYTVSYGSSIQVYLFKTDASGDTAWTETFGGSSIDVGCSVQQTLDGGYIFAGYTQSYGAGSHDVYLIKTDAETWLPYVNLIYPNGGEYFAGNTICPMTWSLFDSLSHVDHLLLYYSINGGTSYPNLIADNILPSDTTFNWQIPVLNTASMRVKVETMDSAGNVLYDDASDTNFTIDSSPPQPFNLQSPLNGAWASAFPLFDWEAAVDTLAGISHYQLWIDNLLARDSILTDTAYALAPLAANWHTWKVKAFDRAGNNTSTTTWSFRVDDINPTAFNLLTPANNTITNDATPTFQWSASEDNGCGLWGYKIFEDSLGGVLLYTIQGNQTTFTPDTGNYLSQGMYDWFVRAYDNVSNWTQSNQTWSLTIDYTPPDSFNLNSPANNSISYLSDVEFRWYKTYDYLTGVKKYQLVLNDSIWVDSISVADSISGTSMMHYWYYGQPNGVYSWKVNAVDYTNNVRVSNQTWNLTVDVDTSGPVSFNLISPDSMECIPYPTPMFIWEGTWDAGIGFSHYQLWIEDTLNVDDLTDTTTTPLLPMPEGYADWYVKALDLFGNETNSIQTWTVILDWNPPEPFDLAFPEDGDTVYTLLPLFGWYPSFDWGAGLSKYELWVDGIVAIDSIPANDTSAHAPEILPVGAHSWFVKAYDRVGGVTPSNQIWQVMTMLSTPASPENILISINNNDIVVSWNPVTSDTSGNLMQVSYYNIYRSANPYFTPDSSNWQTAAVDTFFVDEGVISANPDMYFYQVKAYFDPGTSYITVVEPGDIRIRNRKANLTE